MLLAATICDLDQVVLERVSDLSRIGTATIAVFMAGEKTDHLLGRRRLTAEDHAERSEHLRLGPLDQPKQNIAKNIDLALTKSARAEEKQVRYLLQHLKAAPGRTVPDGAVKFDNEFSGSNGRHGHCPK